MTGVKAEWIKTPPPPYPGPRWTRFENTRMMGERFAEPNAREAICCWDIDKDTGKSLWVWGRTPSQMLVAVHRFLHTVEGTRT